MNDTTKYSPSRFELLSGRTPEQIFAEWGASRVVKIDSASYYSSSSWMTVGVDNYRFFIVLMPDGWHRGFATSRSCLLEAPCYSVEHGPMAAWLESESALISSAIARFSRALEEEMDRQQKIWRAYHLEVQAQSKRRLQIEAMRIQAAEFEAADRLADADELRKQADKLESEEL